MGKQSWKPGNMLYPVPAVLVSCRDKEGNDNVLTVAWAGTICSDPAMVSISVRKERHSYPMIKESGVFVINLTTKDLVQATDYWSQLCFFIRPLTTNIHKSLCDGPSTGCYSCSTHRT